MANQPLLKATVNITAKDINSNNVAKQFNNVLGLNFDYNTGKINVIDTTGSFYFSLSAISSLTYTIVTGLNGSHTVVTS
jgi:hypothetical protein